MGHASETTAVNVEGNELVDKSARICKETLTGSLNAPIPFVTLSDESVFEISHEAVEYLRDIRGPIAVVSIAGLYRTGKSYLLNLLLGREKAESMFNVGATVNACTKGIWIWGQPVGLTAEAKAHESFKHLSADTTIVFMDTEGLGSTQRSQTQDTRIFALALLLSSLFIYNSRGVIDSNAIEDLSLVVNLTKYIQVQANGSSEGQEGSELAAFFPDFLWVVRDFTLQLEEDGRKVTPRDYFESALKLQPPVSEEVAQKNKIRALLASFFPQRDCITMVRPLNDENLLRDLVNQPYDSLRSEFREQMDTLKSKLFNSLKPKTLMQSALNGSMLVKLTESYVAAFNSGTTPVISSAWDRVISSQCEEALDEAKNAFSQAVDSELGQRMESLTIAQNVMRTPVEENELIEVFDKSETIAVEKVSRDELKANAEAFDSCVEQLSEYMIEFLQKKYAENDAISVAHNQAILNELNSAIQANLIVDPHADEGTQALQDQWKQTRDSIERIVVDYRSRSKGPQKSAVLVDFLTQRFVDGLIEWGSSLRTAFRLNESSLESQITSAKQALRAVEGKTRAAQEVLAQQTESYERALQTIKDRLTDERTTLRDEIRSKQAEIERAHQQMERLAALHKEALSRLDAQLEEAREERKRLEDAQRETVQKRDLARMQSSAMLLESERNFHREEKTLLQTQQDLMQKLVDLERQLGEQDTSQMKEIYQLEKDGQRELSDLRIRLQDDKEELKETTIQEIRSLKEEQDMELLALRDELSEKRALLASLRERLEAKEAMAAMKKSKHSNFLSNREDCVLQ